MCSFGEVEAVRNFKYLGSIVNNENMIQEEITARIASAHKCSWAPSKLLRSRRISRRTKLKIYTTMIRPIITYGGETWTLTQELNRQLMVFERTILRRIFGPIYDPELHAWRIRHNEELDRLAGFAPLTNFIRAMRVRWAGHLARMDDQTPTKQVFMGRPEGRRPPGRPRKRWEDVIRTDISSTGLRNARRWMDVAADRGRWRQLVVAARDRRRPTPAE